MPLGRPGDYIWHVCICDARNVLEMRMRTVRNAWRASYDVSIRPYEESSVLYAGARSITAGKALTLSDVQNCHYY
eukprot:IDg20399t1